MVDAAASCALVRPLVPVFLIAQILLVHWATGHEQAPAPPDSARFPAQFNEWRQLRDEPDVAGAASFPGVRFYMNRDYAQASSGVAANLFIVWYASERGGEDQPHSPRNCLPAAGWITVARGEAALDTSAGPIRINRLVTQNGAARGVVLYWYQTHRRVVAGEWSAKFWLVGDALRDHRSDVALVRIFVQNGARGDDAATATATSLARSLYPRLRDFLPR